MLQVLITEQFPPPPSSKDIHRTFNEREKEGMLLLRFDQWFERKKNHIITETQSVLKLLNLLFQNTFNLQELSKTSHLLKREIVMCSRNAHLEWQQLHHRLLDGWLLQWCANNIIWYLYITGTGSGVQQIQTITLHHEGQGERGGNAKFIIFFLYPLCIHWATALAPDSPLSVLLARGNVMQ